MTTPSSLFLGPEVDGWRRLTPDRAGRFTDVYGEVRFRREPDGRVRARTDTRPDLVNLHGGLHGGFLLAFTDIAVSGAPAIVGVYAFGGAVTLRAGMDFIAPGEIGPPLDAVAEVLATSGRTVFVQGVMEQEGRRIAAFEGMMRIVRRKPSAPSGG